VSAYTRAAEDLGRRLRALRESTGESGVRFARRLGWPQSRLSKIENGRQTPTEADIEAWCQAASASAEQRADLLAALAEVHEEYVSWRQQVRRGAFAAKQTELAELEAAARRIRNYEIATLPGLVQIPEYAKHAMVIAGRAAGLEFEAAEVEQAIAGRMRRQEALYQAGRVELLIRETALTWPACPPDTTAAQLDRLAALAGLSTARIGIIPAAAPAAVLPAHGFWIYDDEVVVVEILSAELMLRAPRDIDLYQRAWDRLVTQAVFGDEARALIHAAARG
jgi:transcriptional regulator with XRE-family HTH domain